MDKDLNVKIVKSKEDADRVVYFMLSGRAFDFEFTFGEEAIIKGSVNDSVENKDIKYWFLENSSGKIVGVVGLQEDAYKSGGYIITYIALDQDYRSKGLGKKLLLIAEEYIFNKSNARFILLETESSNLTDMAKAFYDRNGYKNVAIIPDFFGEGNDKLFFQKFLTKEAIDSIKD